MSRPARPPPAALCAALRAGALNFLTAKYFYTYYTRIKCCYFNMRYNQDMKFAELCGYFERIEATTKRLEKTVILAELLKKIEVGEVRVVINLALGQLAAPYLRIQSNLAEKMLIRAIAQSVRMSTDDVTAKFKVMGDLGELMRALGDATTGRVGSSEALSTTEVYEQLLAIAQESGSGSQERKQTKLVHLLSQSSAVEAKYIVRMVNESLRLGFSESTMQENH